MKILVCVLLICLYVELFSISEVITYRSFGPVIYQPNGMPSFWKQVTDYSALKAPIVQIPTLTLAFMSCFFHKRVLKYLIGFLWPTLQVAWMIFGGIREYSTENLTLYYYYMDRPWLASLQENLLPCIMSFSITLVVWKTFGRAGYKKQP